MFKKFEEEAFIIRPGEKAPVGIKTEIRVDPLTGDTARITLHRVDDPPVDFDNPPYRERVRESKKGCPFCPGRIEKATPSFPPDLVAEGMFIRNKSILFPNLFPYGRHSAVSTFSPEHFIEIGDFTPAEYTDNLINARAYISRVFEADPGVRYAAVTQNYLPSSGGTLIHPHFQINIVAIPTNFLRALSVGSRDYLIDRGRCFWEHLIEREEHTKERIISRHGDVAWLTPFAPRGQKEVWAIFENRSDFRDVSDWELADLSEGIVAVQAYYRHTGNNAFNLGIYSVAGAESSYRLLMRMMVRTKFAPFARNDQSYFEVILGEAATDEFPEKIASDLKKYLK